MNALQSYIELSKAMNSDGLSIVSKRFVNHDERPSIGQMWCRLTDTIAVIIELKKNDS